MLDQMPRIPSQPFTKQTFCQTKQTKTTQQQQQQTKMDTEMGWGNPPLVTTIPSSRDDIMMPVKCSRVVMMQAVRLPGTCHMPVTWLRPVHISQQLHDPPEVLQGGDHAGRTTPLGPATCQAHGSVLYTLVGNFMIPLKCSRVVMMQAVRPPGRAHVPQLSALCVALTA